MLHATLRHRQARLAGQCRAALVALTLLGMVPPAVPPAQAQESAAVREAEMLAQSGRHLEAAARYEGVAKKGFLSWDARLALLAAREYAAAGEPAEAARMADKARSRVRTDEERALMALVDGTLALGRGDAVAAAALLRSAPMSVPNDLAADVLALRGRAQIAAGQPVAGLRSRAVRPVAAASTCARNARRARAFAAGTRLARTARSRRRARRRRHHVGRRGRPQPEPRR